MNHIEKSLKKIKIVPVVTLNDLNKAIPLAKVLIENGLPCIEITFRTAIGVEAIKLIRKQYPNMLIGAGTILNMQQVDSAIEARVDFIVSPGLNPEIVKYCQEKKIMIIPGVNNPSLVEQAMSMGLKMLKFFPAEASGGIAMLKSLSAVYPISFMPSGGINATNVNEYLVLPSVIACGGSWMVPNSLINNSDWKGIARLIKSVID